MNHCFVRFFSDGKSCIVGNTFRFAPFCAWLMCRIIAKCERHGCAQKQYGECHPSVLSPCCVRRIRPSRPMSPSHHRALLGKHYGLIGDAVAIAEGQVEPNQRPEDKIVHRSAASPRKRRQAVIPVVQASLDDEILE